MNIRINETFKSLIPALSAEEFNQLEQNIIQDGCRDPLVLWGDTLIDGHNRYTICNDNDIEFKTVGKTFDNERDVEEWIIFNQFGRRNLSAYNRSLLALKLKPIFKIKASCNLKTHTEQGYQNSDKADIVNTNKELAKVAGVSHDTIAKVEKIESLGTAEVKEQITRGDISINQAYQQVRRTEKVEAIKKKVIEKSCNSTSIDIYNTDNKYSIIYADPAWSYFESGNKNQSLHYNTMSIDDICSLPIKNIADDNCILFIWVTFPILQESFKVIEAWGFKYSTCGFNWIKKNKVADSNFFGCGAWTRANSELCLIATKGSVLRLDNTISQILETQIEGHSQKPPVVRELITRLVGELPRIELFSRNNTDGWDVFGDMV